MTKEEYKRSQRVRRLENYSSTKSNFKKDLVEELKKIDPLILRNEFNIAITFKCINNRHYPRELTYGEIKTYPLSFINLRNETMGIYELERFEFIKVEILK